MTFDKGGKNAEAGKNFLIMQRFLREAAKNTFCSLESPGSWLYIPTIDFWALELNPTMWIAGVFLFG